jgi:hypothetical protein
MRPCWDWVHLWEPSFIGVASFIYYSLLETPLRISRSGVSLWLSRASGLDLRVISESFNLLILKPNLNDT